MFVHLWLKECRLLLKSITYLLFVVIIGLFYATQMGSQVQDDIRDADPGKTAASHQQTAGSTMGISATPPASPFAKPLPGQSSYGEKTAENPATIMPEAVQSLYMEYTDNRYASYPLGFFKAVKLSPSEQEKIAAAITEITGSTMEQLRQSISDASQKAAANGLPLQIGRGNSFSFPIHVTYDRFKEVMAGVEKLTGSSSSYSLQHMIDSYGHSPITYAEKLAEYNDFIQKDRITGAYARLFSDYMGIMLAFLPVFVTVFFIMRDRRAGMQDLIYTRKISSSALVAARYLALIAMMILPVLFLSLHPLIQLMGYAGDHGITIDHLAFVKYIAAWLMPTLMVSTAVGMFLTELTDTPIAIVVQGLWWFISLNSARFIMDGGYGSQLILRHNTIGNLQVYQDHWITLLLNRLGYTALALILVLLTVGLVQLKRRGKLNARSKLTKILAAFKIQSKARVVE
ncbi:ABC transporter permease [Paenibacillus sp. HJL G12]|uniref:ABC transporter permease n=1 Tax=Paenibacillus dendrobii TaxID=2691084 RepID=A0A7X3IM83_9BACL|nr:ABC transporter permease [Paenibacillus dendrobii]MWV46016.1 ABC transporter permease [Paenibacillus dendrobii]